LKPRIPRHLPLLGLAGLCALALLIGGYAGIYDMRQTGASGQQHVGRVKVLYAGSLAHVLENAIAPAFMQSTGGKFQGVAGGSTGLAHEIRDKIRRADIFISARPEVNKRLMDARNGDWVDWYISFMSSPLVIGYNPNSKFAAEFASMPWYEVVSLPGFRLGRTDERIDPKGDLTIQAIEQTAKLLRRPGLATQIMENTQVFPEQGLVGRLQTGQLDAGFFYRGEALAVGLPTVSIEPISLGAKYTITLLKHAPNPDGAIHFISFLLGARGRDILQENGFELLTPATLIGDESALPQALKPLLEAK